jgi:transcriptional regulator with XRE-family HTH domain
MQRPHGDVSVNPTDERADATPPPGVDGPPQTVQTVGALIRLLRTKARRSLGNVAEAAGLSPGLLSQIERGMGNPSLTTLVKLAHALDVPVGRFFVSERPTHALVRRGEHPRLQLADDSIVHELLTPHTHGRLGMIKTMITSGWTNENAPFAHDGEECVYVTDGKLTISIAETRYLLGEGDSVTFDSALPHWYRNDTGEAAVTISAMTPPSF